MNQFKNPGSNQFHKTTLDKAIAFYWYGMINVSGLLYFAVTIYRKEGQTFKIDNIPAFCEKLGITQRAFYKAKATLVSTGFLEEEIYGAVGLKAVRLYDEQSFTQTEQSFTQTEQSFTQTEQSFTTTASKPLHDKGSSDPSDIDQILIKSLSDPQAGTADQLTAESTGKVGSRNSEEREKKNKTLHKDKTSAEDRKRSLSLEDGFFIDYRSQPDSVDESVEVEEKKQELICSTSLAKKDEPRSEPKNSSEEKSFGARSTKKMQNTTKKRRFNATTLIPKAVETLKQELSFTDEDCKDFEEFAAAKAKRMNKEKVELLDDWLRPRLDAIACEYLRWKKEKEEADRRRQVYEVVEDKPVKEKSQPQKSKSNLKNIFFQKLEQKGE